MISSNEGSLTSLIDSETSARQTADSSILSLVSSADGSLASAIDSEISLRSSADSSIVALIGSEGSSITSLESRISTEESTRSVADSSIVTLLNSADSSIIAVISNLAGSGLTYDANNKLDVVLDSTNTLAFVGANNALRAGVQFIHEAAPATGTTGAWDTLLTLAYTPAGTAYIDVELNGVGYTVSYGDTTGSFYFGATGKTRTSLVAGDALYFNATNATFGLDSNDVVTITYTAILP